ncbi:MAG: hypothetical protein AAFV43_07250 [Planctomycetota bacterium]
MTDVSFLDLWLPILAAGLATHVLSTIAWVALPHHKPEWNHLPLTGTVGEAIRSEGLRDGEQYVLTDADAGDPDPAKCRGMLILWRHTPSMGANIGMTLTFFVVAAAAIGYLASMAFPAGAPSIDVFRFTATAGLLTYAAAGTPTLIWFRRKWLMDLLDGVAYALATGAAFALLWPAG